MTDLDAIRNLIEEWDREQMSEGVYDVDIQRINATKTLLAEVERLRGALTREVPHMLDGCYCRHPPADHVDVLLCRGCVASVQRHTGPELAAKIRRFNGGK